MKRQRLTYWLCAAAAVAAVLCGCLNDRTDRTWTADALPAENEVFIGASRHAADGRLEPGPFTGGPGVALEAGRYRAIVRYQITQPGNTAEVLSAGLLNPDNTLGRVLAAAELDPAVNEISIPFALEAGVTDLEVRTGFAGGVLTLHSVSIVSVGLSSTDHILWAAMLLAAAALLYWMLFRGLGGAGRPGGPVAMGGAAVGSHTALADKPLDPARALRLRLRRLAPVLLVAAIGLAASTPAFAGFSPFGWDLEFHLTRIEGIAGAWRGGQFPARVVPGPVGDKGYLLGAMYPDLFLWPAALLRLLGCSLQGSYNFTLLALNLTTAGIAYYSGARLFHNKRAGLVVALLYTFAQYRIVNVYARAALGEAWAMAFLPLAVLALYELFFGDAGRWPLAVAAATGVLQSHILTCFIAGLFALAFGLIFCRRLWAQKVRLAALGKAAGLSLLLNAWFLLPFVWYSGQGLGVFTTFHYSLAREALHPAQLFMLTSQGGAVGEDMPLGPGLVLWLCAALGAVALLALKKRGGGRQMAARSILAACLAFSLPALWMCTRLFPWAAMARVPLVGTAFTALQFPWRFLIVPAVLLSLAGGALVVLRPPKKQFWALFAAVAAVCLLTQLPTMDRALDNPRTLTPDTRDRALDMDQLYGGQYLYAGTDADALVKRPNLIAAEKEATVIEDYRKAGLNVSLRYAGEGPQWLDLPLTWYPGYEAVDGTGAELAVSRQAEGLVRVQLKTAAGSLRVRYAGVGWHRAGDAVSLLAVLALAGYPVLQKRRGGPTGGRRSETGTVKNPTEKI